MPRASVRPRARPGARSWPRRLNIPPCATRRRVTARCVLPGVDGFGRIDVDAVRDASSTATSRSCTCQLANHEVGNAAAGRRSDRAVQGARRAACTSTPRPRPGTSRSTSRRRAPTSCRSARPSWADRPVSARCSFDAASALDPLLARRRPGTGAARRSRERRRCTWVFDGVAASTCSSRRRSRSNERTRSRGGALAVDRRGAVRRPG